MSIPKQRRRLLVSVGYVYPGRCWAGTAGCTKDLHFPYRISKYGGSLYALHFYVTTRALERKVGVMLLVSFNVDQCLPCNSIVRRLDQEIGTQRIFPFDANATEINSLAKVDIQELAIASRAAPPCRSIS